MELADQSCSAAHASWITRHLAKTGFGIALSVRACALALLGRSDDPRESIHRALAESGGKSRPDMAGIHYRSAQALKALRAALEAEAHLREAAKLDPDGLWGRHARHELTGTA